MCLSRDRMLTFREFTEIMEFFLRPENAEIWAQIQDLAERGDLASIQKYVQEAQRLTSIFRTVRYAVEPGEVEGQKFDIGDVLVLNIVS
jgi:linoleate 10R-lipoxygenase